MKNLSRILGLIVGAVLFLGSASQGKASDLIFEKDASEQPLGRGGQLISGEDDALERDDTPRQRSLSEQVLDFSIEHQETIATALVSMVALLYCSYNGLSNKEIAFLSLAVPFFLAWYG